MNAKYLAAFALLVGGGLALGVVPYNPVGNPVVRTWSDDSRATRARTNPDGGAAIALTCEVPQPAALADGGTDWNFTYADGGLDLQSLGAVSVNVCAKSDSLALANTGSLRACYWDWKRNMWMRLPEADKSISLTTRCQAFSDSDVIMPWGKIFWYADGVTITGGDGGLNLDIKAHGLQDPLVYTK